MALALRHEGRVWRVRWSPADLMSGLTDDAHATDSAGGSAMPEAASDDKARTLFLTPGGKYTEADITANGSTTAAEKYRGLMAKHNRQPQRGARLCPITDTQADPRFQWIVGGKTYRFCCPPCAEEFVRLAKEKPDTIKEPDAYVKP